MDAIENQIGEDATLLAPASWIAAAEIEYHARRRVTVRELCELAAMVAVGVILAMVV